MSHCINPYWHELLRHFEKKQYFNNGLTIPFLIGAREIVEPKMHLLTVSDFVYELRDFGATILKCDYLGEFVIGALDRNSDQLKVEYYKYFGKLVITDQSLDQFTDFEEFKDFVEILYRNQIKKREYSKESGVWRKFSSLEKNRIKEVVL